MRSSGILLPVSSLPSEYGIGCFSKSAYEFVDNLREAGQRYWQILPLGPTSYGDSPYQSFSTFAGNPYFIDLETLIQQGLLTEEECRAVDFGEDPQYADYEKLHKGRETLLRTACQRSGLKESQKFRDFLAEQREWLEDYALYMAIKKKMNHVSWLEWPRELRDRDPDTMEACRRELGEDIYFCQFVQYEFYRQWNELRRYANRQGVQIIGDIPIYVALDSSDVWADRELFQFGEDGLPTAIAGCPPDGFSATGQLWGNPLYDWNCHRATGYEWWIRRMRCCSEWYDVVRIDHFRGFDQYYAIPFGDKTAEHGQWQDGPGLELFQAIQRALGEIQVIAEDLGFITEGVEKLVRDTGYPGMKVLEFAFDSREASNYLPHTYTSNCVVYTGTHDNETIAGWYQNLCPEDLEYCRDYMGNWRTPREEIHWDFIRLAMMSVAEICIIPMQDYLGLDNRARMNQPSTVGGNWRWRLQKGQTDPKLLEKIRKLTIISGRGNY